ncbi:LPXTG cell wall anchor domain-containing protein [uncultured Streptococcus sp.]
MNQLLAKQKKNNSLQTGSQDSAGLVAAGLMATLAAYGLTKRKED